MASTKMVLKSNMAMSLLCLCAHTFTRNACADLMLENGSTIFSTQGIYLDSNGDQNHEVSILTNGRVGIATSTPLSTLEIGGTLGLSVERINADRVLSGNTTILVDTTMAPVTLTLPYAANVTGLMYMIKKQNETNDLIISGANLIDDQSSVTLKSSSFGFPHLNVISSGNQWYILSVSGNG